MEADFLLENTAEISTPGEAALGADFLLENTAGARLLHQPSSDRDWCKTIWLKGKNCISSGKNEKLAPIVIGVEVRSQIETEGTDRDRCGASIAT